MRSRVAGFISVAIGVALMVMLCAGGTGFAIRFGIGFLVMLYFLAVAKEWFDKSRRDGDEDGDSSQR